MTCLRTFSSAHWCLNLVALSAEDMESGKTDSFMAVNKPVHKMDIHSAVLTLTGHGFNKIEAGCRGKTQRKMKYESVLRSCIIKSHLIPRSLFHKVIKHSRKPFCFNVCR